MSSNINEETAKTEAKQNPAEAGLIVARWFRFIRTTTFQLLYSVGSAKVGCYNFLNKRQDILFAKIPEFEVEIIDILCSNNKDHQKPLYYG